MTNFGGAVKKCREYDFAILGVPFDDKSSYLRGPAGGPKAIREASTDKAINAWTELGIDLEADAAIVDLGDIDTSGDFLDVFERIEREVGSVADRKAVPVVLGGDHSITYPVVKGISRVYQPLDLLHFDAHPDLYDELYGDRFSHACPFARIVDDGLVQNLVQVGIRAATGAHRDRTVRSGIRMVEMKDVAFLEALHFSNPLYISVDVDVLDPAFAPGVSHHEPGGLSTRQLLRILQQLEAEVIGLDIVEVNPVRDGSGITAAAAVKIVMEIMGGIIWRRKKDLRRSS
jgi:agmatinase